MNTLSFHHDSHENEPMFGLYTVHDILDVEEEY